MPLLVNVISGSLTVFNGLYVWCFSASTMVSLKHSNVRILLNSRTQVLHRHECGELQYTPCTRSFHRTEKEYGDRKCNPCSESTCTSTLRRSRKGKVASSLDIEQIGFVSFKYYICTNLLPINMFIFIIYTRFGMPQYHHFTPMFYTVITHTYLFLLYTHPRDG